MNSTAVTRILQSRGTAILTACICGAAVWYAFREGVIADIGGDNGLALPSPDQWISDRTISLWAGIGVTFGIAALMTALNGIFNFIRSISVGYASIFLLMQMAVPDIAGQLYGGSVLAAATLVCAMLLFSCYDGAGSNRRIFLTFFIIASGVVYLYSFLYLIPVFFIGLLQMRALSTRTFVAAATGLVTPLWILAGFGVIDLTDLHTPHFSSIFTSIDTSEALHLVFIVATTALIGISSWIMNFTKIIAYNARTRAFNGFITLITFASLLMIVLDYTDLPTYLPVFNVCAAFQAGHLTAMRQRDHGYIFICCLWALYLSFYLWRMLV